MSLAGWARESQSAELDENYIKAFGNVQMNQGDTITMNSRYAEYNGDKELAFATGDVVLRSPESILTTDTVYFDKKKNCFCNHKWFLSLVKSRNQFLNLIIFYFEKKRKIIF